MKRVTGGVDAMAARLDPGAFAAVMATGIVSLACNQQGLPGVAWALFLVNLGAYAGLWVLTLIRVARFGDRLLADVMDSAHAAGFFTLVAATCVVGSQFAVLPDLPGVAVAFWFLGTALWFVLVYSFFLLAFVKSDKPHLADAVNGGWLLVVVATQAVSYLGSLLITHFGSAAHLVLLFTLGLWLAGGLLYLPLITLILYRLLFFRLSAANLTGPYWINMGALAITTLAGTGLSLASPAWPSVQAHKPFIDGLTLLFWAFGVWWIPLLLLLGIWRHIVKRYPLHYADEYWAIVFPLGMFSAATNDLARSAGFHLLFVTATYGTYIALGAWLLLVIGLIVAIASGIRGGPASDWRRSGGSSPIADSG